MSGPAELLLWQVKEKFSCTLAANLNFEGTTTGYFNKIYPIFMLNFEKPRFIMQSCIISKPVSFS